jgi:biopolymer transport protein ExbD
MALSIGPSDSSSEDEVMMEINTTPLIDVMLVLLVMLIITIPIQLHAVNLELPVGKPPQSDLQPLIVKIDIDRENTVYWQGLPVTGPQLEINLKSASTMAVQPEIHIRPDKDSKYELFAHLMATTKRMGLTKVAVIGSEQFVH